MSVENEDGPKSYVIRLRERAMRDIDAAYVRIAEAISERAAAGWSIDLEDTLASLALFPQRCPIAQEAFHHEVRQLLYQRSGSRLAYRILFTIINDGTESSEPPTVVILTVRHASAKEMSRGDIRQIETEL